MKRLAPVGTLLLTLVLLASLPAWIGNSYYVNIASQVLLYAVFALGLNVIVGYAGLVSLGHAGLFGIAAYTGAILINAGHGHFLSIAGALVVTLAASGLFAMLALRGTGLGFVMITVALGQIVWGVAYRWISLTNGDNGVSITSRPAPFGLFLLVLSIAATWQITYAPYVADYSRYLPANTSIRAAFWWTYGGSVLATVFDKYRLSVRG